MTRGVSFEDTASVEVAHPLDRLRRPRSTPHGPDPLVVEGGSISTPRGQADHRAPVKAGTLSSAQQAPVPGMSEQPARRPERVEERLTLVHRERVPPRSSACKRRARSRRQGSGSIARATTHQGARSLPERRSHTHRRLPAASLLVFDLTTPLAHGARVARAPARRHPPRRPSVPSSPTRTSHMLLRARRGRVVPHQRPATAMATPPPGPCRRRRVLDAPAAVADLSPSAKRLREESVRSAPRARPPPPARQPPRPSSVREDGRGAAPTMARASTPAPRSSRSGCRVRSQPPAPRSAARTARRCRRRGRGHRPSRKPGTAPSRSHCRAAGRLAGDVEALALVRERRDLHVEEREVDVLPRAGPVPVRERARAPRRRVHAGGRSVTATPPSRRPRRGRRPARR